MTDEDVQKLYDEVLKKVNKELMPAQSIKFKEACRRVFLDNPGNNFSDHIIAANIYLNYILHFPDLTLPPEQVQLP